MKAGQTIWIDGRHGVITSAYPVTVNGTPALLVDVEHNPGHRYFPHRVEYYLPPESEDENDGEVQEEKQTQVQGQEEKEGTREAERVPG